MAATYDPSRYTATWAPVPGEAPAAAPPRAKAPASSLGYLLGGADTAEAHRQHQQHREASGSVRGTGGGGGAGSTTATAGSNHPRRRAPPKTATSWDFGSFYGRPRLGVNRAKTAGGVRPVDGDTGAVWNDAQWRDEHLSRADLERLYKRRQQRSRNRRMAAGAGLSASLPSREALRDQLLQRAQAPLHGTGRVLVSNSRAKGKAESGGDTSGEGGAATAAGGSNGKGATSTDAANGDGNGAPAGSAEGASSPTGVAADLTLVDRRFVDPEHLTHARQFSRGPNGAPLSFEAWAAAKSLETRLAERRAREAAAAEEEAWLAQEAERVVAGAEAFAKWLEQRDEGDRKRRAQDKVKAALLAKAKEAEDAQKADRKRAAHDEAEARQRELILQARKTAAEKKRRREERREQARQREAAIKAAEDQQVMDSKFKQWLAAKEDQEAAERARAAADAEAARQREADRHRATWRKKDTVLSYSTAARDKQAREDAAALGRNGGAARKRGRGRGAAAALASDPEPTVATSTFAEALADAIHGFGTPQKAAPAARSSSGDQDDGSAGAGAAAGETKAGGSGSSDYDDDGFESADD